MHYARLAEFYPACRHCVHHDDTGCLSEKLVKRLHEIWNDGREPASFQDVGFVGNSPNELPPVMVRQVAAAFGLWLQRSVEKSPFAERKETIAIAHDARSIMPEYVANICEGLRHAACEVFDIGPATSAAMQFAVQHFELDGGILLGSIDRRPQAICLKFWGIGPQRMLGKSAFQPLEEILQSGFDRPERKFGAQHRLQAETPYLAALADQFHGLRPLRIAIESTSRPWLNYFEKLLQSTACRIIPSRVLPHEFPGQIAADAAHFGISVANDGECFTFFDEQGRQFDPCSPSLLDALAAVIHLLQVLSRDDRPCSEALGAET
jgi:phosphomannomutase